MQYLRKRHHWGMLTYRYRGEDPAKPHAWKELYCRGGRGGDEKFWGWGDSRASSWEGVLKRAGAARGFDSAQPPPEHVADDNLVYAPYFLNPVILMSRL